LRLYLITDRHQTCGRPLLDVVRLSLEGGVRVVQLREKDLTGGELYPLAMEMRGLTREFGAGLIINDRLDIALAVEADGVHVGISSLPVKAVRRIIGPDKIIGYSAHAIDEALNAQSNGADFVTFGPVYYTPSKGSYGEPCGIKKLADAAAALKIPVIALGGIISENITEALAANVRGVAVISAVLNAPDPRSATEFLLKKIEEYAQHS
jgi:thiamine-phosphate pyrophosphorylase